MGQKLLVTLLLFALLFQENVYEISSNVCGTTEFDSEPHESLDVRISGGSQVGRGEWPFLAALYYTEEAEFFCGGTLISAKNVLTGMNRLSTGSFCNELFFSCSLRTTKEFSASTGT